MNSGLREIYHLIVINIKTRKNGLLILEFELRGFARK